jgi:hypothetical protein
LPPPGDSFDDDLIPRGFDQEEAADLRRQFVRQTIRMCLAFAALFAGVYFALWWSGSAVRFGAAQAAGRAAPSWHVLGTVRDAVTGDPIPWATVEDEPVAGHPPLFRTDADRMGAFDLLTAATRHRIRVTAPGYSSITFPVGRVWFLWAPNGKERQDVRLTPN